MGQEVSRGEEAAAATALGGPPCLASVAAALREGRLCRVLVLAGAGLSVSAGVPDFRSPGPRRATGDPAGSGLYETLRGQGIAAPEDLFHIGAPRSASEATDSFRRDPRTFFALTRTLLDRELRPTLAHSFLALLERRGLLLRVYTQNVDGLELAAGVSSSRLVEAHGSFASATCLACGRRHSRTAVETALRAERLPLCEVCGAVVKPDVVLYGEQLPPRFLQLHAADLKAADLLLILGTSLRVAPLSLLPDRVAPSCVRVLMNHEPVGEASLAPGEVDSDWDARQVVWIDRTPAPAPEHDEEDEFPLDWEDDGHYRLGSDAPEGPTHSGGLRFRARDNVRDVFVRDDCDAAVRTFARMLGWEEELDRVHAETERVVAEAQRRKDDAPSVPLSESDEAAVADEAPGSTADGAPEQGFSSVADMLALAAARWGAAPRGQVDIVADALESLGLGDEGGQPESKDDGTRMRLVEVDAPSPELEARSGRG